MTRLRWVALSLALLAACSSGGDGAEVKLDGSPRHPDDQGIATEVGRERIVIDGKRRYSVSPDLKSFSTQTLETVPLITRKGQYVQVGLKGKTVVWIAGIAGVIPSKPPRVHYQGELVRVDDGDAVFKDGTVLALAKALAKTKPGLYTVLVDPSSHQVVEMRPM